MDERQAHRAIFAGLNAISTVRNTKADALLVAIEPKESWCVVYEYPDQARAITQNARRAEVAGFRPALPRDLEVCRSCVVTGWSSRSFARRLWAHTPRRITALVDARSASQFCERMLESSSSPSAIVRGTNLLSGWWSAEIPKEFRGYGRRPVDCADDGKAEICSLPLIFSEPRDFANLVRSL
jgi:hypothetical protein